MTGRAIRHVGAALIALIAPTAFAACGGAEPDPAGRPRALTVTGYLVPWDDRSGIASNTVTAVSPVWFQPTDTGGVVYASPEGQAAVATVREQAAASGVEVIPSVSNFRDGRWDGALVHAIVDDPSQRARHIAALVDVVRSGNWPGVDIDYESLPAASRAGYRTFVRELASALHTVGARLSVTLHAKTSEPGSWPGAQAQDWRAIGESADEVRVMAYDYSSAGSPPGAIAPLPWVEQVLKLAVAVLPREHVALGVPTYGYDWTKGQPGHALQWADVQELAQLTGAEQRWDDKAQSPWLRYDDDDGQSHTIWYENAQSFSAKIEVARRYGLTRLVVWRLGGEDPAIWEAVRSAN